MLHRVFGFADLTAGQVMVPRTELVAVAPMRRATRSSSRSAAPAIRALPVYRDDLDNVVGILHVDRRASRRSRRATRTSTPARSRARR